MARRYVCSWLQLQVHISLQGTSWFAPGRSGSARRAMTGEHEHGGPAPEELDVPREASVASLRPLYRACVQPRAYQNTGGEGVSSRALWTQNSRRRARCYQPQLHRGPGLQIMSCTTTGYSGFPDLRTALPTRVCRKSGMAILKRTSATRRAGRLAATERGHQVSVR
jgi:hypothetical protein